MIQSTVFQIALQLGGIVTMLQESHAQQTTVDCPEGKGKVICTETQVAICWVGEDSASQRCLTPPEGVTDLSLDVWLLSYVFDDTVTVTDKNVESYREIIKAGKWEGAAYNVTFSLPSTWKGTR